MSDKHEYKRGDWVKFGKTMAIVEEVGYVDLFVIPVDGASMIIVAPSWVEPCDPPDTLTFGNVRYVREEAK